MIIDLLCLVLLIHHSEGRYNNDGRAAELHRKLLSNDNVSDQGFGILQDNGTDVNITAAPATSLPTQCFNSNLNGFVPREDCCTAESPCEANQGNCDSDLACIDDSICGDVGSCDLLLGSGVFPPGYRCCFGTTVPEDNGINESIPVWLLPTVISAGALIVIVIGYCCYTKKQQRTKWGSFKKARRPPATALEAMRGHPSIVHRRSAYERSKQESSHLYTNPEDEDELKESSTGSHSTEPEDRLEAGLSPNNHHMHAHASRRDSRRGSRSQSQMNHLQGRRPSRSHASRRASVSHRSNQKRPEHSSSRRRDMPRRVRTDDLHSRRGSASAYSYDEHKSSRTGPAVFVVHPRRNSVSHSHVSDAQSEHGRGRRKERGAQTLHSGRDIRRRTRSVDHRGHHSRHSSVDPDLDFRYRDSRPPVNVPLRRRSSSSSSMLPDVELQREVSITLGTTADSRGSPVRRSSMSRSRTQVLDDADRDLATTLHRRGRSRDKHHRRSKSHSKSAARSVSMSRSRRSSANTSHARATSQGPTGGRRSSTSRKQRSQHKRHGSRSKKGHARKSSSSARKRGDLQGANNEEMYSHSKDSTLDVGHKSGAASKKPLNAKNPKYMTIVIHDDSDAEGRSSSDPVRDLAQDACEKDGGGEKGSNVEVNGEEQCVENLGGPTKESLEKETDEKEDGANSEEIKA